jgi:hypothetical protein
VAASLLLFSHAFEFYSFDCVALIFSLVLSFLSRKKKEQISKWKKISPPEENLEFSDSPPTSPPQTPYLPNPK